MKIEWNKVTKLSQAMAIILFVVVFFVGFLIGKKFENKKILGEKINSAKFICAKDKTISADFYDRTARLVLPNGDVKYLTQTISASGVRYADKGETVVFWNKGDTAFIEERGIMTISDCLVDN